MAERLYEHAGFVIGNAVSKKGSIKSLCFGSEYGNKKKLYALVIEALKYKKIIEKLLRKVQICHPHFQDNEYLLLVLVYDSVFGKGIPKNCKYHELLTKHTDDLVEALEEVSVQYPELVKHKKQVQLPRYVRVNVLKISTDDAIQCFCQHGYNLRHSMDVTSLVDGDFLKDVDIPDVLAFAPNTDLHRFILYKEGKIFLQDKASCLPAFILNPPTATLIIDACAAPGNKSLHLACLIKNDGDIHSFDLDKKRLSTMKELLSKSNAKCVKAEHRDFLKVKHDDPFYSTVEYILLDPSCSGSGIVSRMDGFVDEDVNAENHERRLRSLSGFQTAALSHALSFPNIKRVVYSTCSIHQQENENVVEKAINRFSKKYHLVNIMTSWKNRGIGDWDQAYKCIRAVPEKDYTNGFFVAMFERKKNSVIHEEDTSEKDTVRVALKKKGPVKRTFPKGDNNDDSGSIKNTGKMLKHKKKRKKDLSITVEPQTATGDISKQNNDNKFQRKVPTKKWRKNKKLLGCIKTPIVSTSL